MHIILTGDVQEHEGSFRARVDGLGIHAYGATPEAAEQRALEGARLKLDFWYMQRVLIERLLKCSIRFTLDSATVPPPREAVPVELVSA